MMEMLGNENYLWFPNLCSSLRSCQVLCYWWLCKCKWYVAGLLGAEPLHTARQPLREQPAPLSQPRLPWVAFLLPQHSTMGSVLPHEPSTIIMLTPHAGGGPLVIGVPSKDQGGGTVLLGSMRSYHQQNTYGQRCPRRSYTPLLQPCPC